MTKSPSWDDLKPRVRAEIPLDRYAELCLQTFSTPAGRELLDLLHQKYIDGVLPGYPEQSALVQHNAKRQLVAELEQKAAEGAAALAKKGKQNP